MARREAMAKILEPTEKLAIVERPMVCCFKGRRQYTSSPTVVSLKCRLSMDSDDAASGPVGSLRSGSRRYGPWRLRLMLI